MIDAYFPDPVPRPVARLLRRLPQWPPSAAVATVLNFGFAARLDGDALDQLRGKVIRIVARDAAISITLCYDGVLFQPLSASQPADVTISASVRDFALLAARKEDPDTLFFARRLSMDGDTETGLIVKNMLDALDLQPLLARLQWARSVFERLRVVSPAYRNRARGEIR